MVNKLSTISLTGRSSHQQRRTFFILCLSFSAIFYIAAATNTAKATTYYLDAVNGNDANAGDSEHPWKTLGKALSIISSGDTVYLRSGNYGAFQDSVNRTGWTYFAADTGQTPVITEVRFGQWGSPQIEYNSYLDFTGITFTPGHNSGVDDIIWLYHSNYIKIHDCNFVSTGYTDRGSVNTACIQSQYSNYVTVDSCKFYGRIGDTPQTGKKYCIRTDTHSDYWVINDCNITNCAVGININGVDHQILRNTIHHTTSDGILAANTTNLLVEGNTIHDVERFTWLSDTTAATYTASTLTITAASGTPYANVQYNDQLKITLSDGSSPVTSTGNRWPSIDHAADGGNKIVLKAGNGFYPAVDYSNIVKVEVRYNIHCDGFQSWSSSGNANHCDNTILRGNTIYNIEHQALLENAFAAGTPEHWLIENNLIYNIDIALSISEMNDLTFRNNTVVKSSSRAWGYASPTCGSILLQGNKLTCFTGNLIGPDVFGLNYSNPTNNTVIVYENYNIINVWGAYMTGYVPGPNTTIITTNPNQISTFKTLFTNYDSNDFTLAAGSLAIDYSNSDYAPAKDILENSRDTTPDAGCYEYISGTQSYRLNITAANGTVTKTPDKTSYSSDETVTLQATPNTGYYFVNWTGDVTDTNNPTTIIMNLNKSVTANFAANSYTLTITADNGSVAKSPDKSSYNYGETVTLTATANTGYHFSSWSGDASGTSSITSIVINGDKSVTANFAINTYSLTVNASNGSVTKTPNKTSYNYGEQVSLTATANTGYHFSSWSGSATGTSNPTTITINENKTVTANFAINTYTLTVSAVFGSVTKSPDKSLYDYGETVSLQAVPNSNYAFTSWSGDASGSSNPTSIIMNADKSVTAHFVYTLIDNNAPTIAKSNCYPQPDAIQVALDTLFLIYIVDEGRGIDANTVSIEVEDNLVYTGNTTVYSSSYGRCYRIGNIAEYVYIYQPYQTFDFDQTVTVAVSAADLAGNQMNDSYSFRTEMISFGKNLKVNSGTDSLSDGHPATVKDSSGNIWAAWHKGAAGSRDIYVGKLTADATTFESSIQLTTDTSDQCNPVIAADSSDKLYVVWQDNRRGNWDVFFSTSADGVSWSAESRITDSNDNQINPAIAIDRSSPNKVYIAWQDDQNINQDIFAAYSNNSFLAKTTVQVTSNSSDQTEPTIVVDAANTAYILWTDLRNGNQDIYGAASNSGPWTNVAVVTGAGDQSEPAVAAEKAGTTLHLLWVDNSLGNKDIYYSSCSAGLHALSGVSIIDDSTEADQNEPSIIVKGSTGNNLKVFACWCDRRNTDSDLYFAQIGSGSGTNIFVGDNDTGSAQSAPVIGIDADGYPYILWVDNRNANTDIFYAGSTYAQTSLLLSQNVSMNSDTTVGTVPSAITSLDDISILITAGTLSTDVNITGSKVNNLPNLSINILSAAYEFGPSGITFDQPVTVTIPYIVSDSGSATAYWYNILTAAASQQGITDVKDTVIFGSLHAISFKTDHFSWYFVGEGASSSNDGGGGGGGGCSLASPGRGGSIIEFALPFLALAIVMTVIKLQDRRNCKRLASKVKRV